MSCCWPRSIARYSGSVRWPGGSWSGWRNWPKSSATPGRSKFWKTGCLTRRFCSISCSTSGRRRRDWKWRGRVRYAARVERILAATAAPAKLGWRKRIWTAAVDPAGRHRVCRQHHLQHAAAARAGDGRRWRSDEAARKPQRVSFYSLGQTSIFAVFREGDDLFGQLSGQRKIRLAAAGDGTYSYPAAAGQISFAVGDQGQPSELTLSQNGRDMHAGTDRRSVVAGHRGRRRAARIICRLVPVGAEPRACRHARRRSALCAGDRTAEIRGRGPRRRCIFRRS